MGLWGRGAEGVEGLVHTNRGGGHSASQTHNEEFFLE